MDEKKKLCPDPECNTENTADATECLKCKLNFDALAGLDSLIAVRDRRSKADTDKKAAEEKAKKPVTLRDTLATIGAKKRGK